MDGESDFQLVWVDPEDLIPYDNNPRVNDEAVAYLVNAIEETGFNSPIIVNEDMVILAGHTRRKAALEARMEKVPVIVRRNLSAEQQQAFRLADNKVSEFSGWDFSKLKEELEALDGIFDMADFGFQPDLDYGADDEPEDVEGEGEEVPFAPQERVYKVMAEFDNPDDATGLLARLESEGIRCKIL